MWPLSLETPAEIASHCPACRPDLDPETYVLAWCGEHRPDISGSADALIGHEYLSGSAEAGGDSNGLICSVVHRGGAAPR